MRDKKKVSKRMVNLDDKKIILSLAFVFIVGTLFSGSFTGNAGRIGVVTQLGPNEFHMYEGSVKFFNGNVVRLDKISEEGSIVVHVVNNQDIAKRVISAGNENYVNGLYITNVVANYKGKTALIKVK
jgi:hypothetical protein